MNHSSLDLFTHSDLPFGAVPFDLVTDKVLSTAFDEVIPQVEQAINAVAESSEPVTFDNTLIALEEAFVPLDQVASVMYNLLSAHSNDSLQALAQRISPRLSKLQSDLSLNESLFQRVKVLYDQVQSGEIKDPVRVRMIENQYDGFVHAGALLSEADKEVYRAVKKELQLLSLDFGQNNVKEQQQWFYKIPLSQHELIDAMPYSVRVMGQSLAQSHPEGDETQELLFNLSAPSLNAILKYCPDESIRRHFYMAAGQLGNRDNEYDNRSKVRRIANLRLQLANLFGYDCYADYALRKRMLNSVDKVYGLLDSLKAKYQDWAKKEIDLIAQQKDEGDFEVWDMAYCTEKYVSRHFEVDEEALKAYFPFDHVRDALFGIANRLYGIRFEHNPSIVTYLPEVKAYELYESDGAFLGLLYLDPFARPTKRNGAWMSNLKDMTSSERPHVIIVMNFTPPSDQQPSLLKPTEVTTFLHEFGHALHGLLTKAPYGSISGTAVSRDFVELPSQFMENFFFESEVMQHQLSRHYLTGKALPSADLAKIAQSSHFPVARLACRQLVFGYLDMAYHTITEPIDDEVTIVDFEREAIKSIWLGPGMPNEESISTHFGHLFAGGYAAGYYGYKWAEVLEADVFARFQEEGVFDKTIADRFRSNILEPGDSYDPMDLFVKMMGSEPNPDALFERDKPFLV